MKDLSRKVSLLCPVCGNDQFQSLDGEFQSAEDKPDEARYKCSDCGIISTKKELIEENDEKINIAVSEIEKEATKEFERELAKMLKKIRF